MKIIGTKTINYCDKCGKLDIVTFTVKGLFMKHDWCYYCLMDNSYRISNLRLLRRIIK